LLETFIEVGYLSFAENGGGHMHHSESISKLVTALTLAQLKTKNPALDKAHPHFRGFRYASLGSHIDAIREVFAENGLAILQGVQSDGPTVSVTTMICHTSGEWIKSTVGMTLAENATAQNIGSCVTYLRRYQLAAMTMLTGEDDTDAEDDRREKEPPKPRPAAPSAPARKDDVFSPQPTGNAAKPKAASPRKWPDAGSDVIRVEKVVDRGDVIALLCAHAVHSSAWVSAPKSIASDVRAEQTLELDWVWNTAGFYEAKSIKEAPRFRDLIAKGEIPF
jgi:hypothetical protein